MTYQEFTFCLNFFFCFFVVVSNAYGEKAIIICHYQYSNTHTNTNTRTETHAHTFIHQDFVGGKLILGEYEFGFTSA